MSIRGKFLERRTVTAGRRSYRKPNRLENTKPDTARVHLGAGIPMPRKDNTMNKFTKGAIATGAGIILLLGGAGTFALWNDSEVVDAGTVNSGVLDITSNSGGQWADTYGNISNIANYKVVPGNTLTYTRTLNISANGDHLNARLTVDPTSITGDAALIGATVVSVSATGGTAANNNNGTPANPADDYVTLSSSASSQAVVVTVKVDFPSTVTGTTGQSQSINLSLLKFLINQV